jgi:hypothetical protein
MWPLEDQGAVEEEEGGESLEEAHDDGEKEHDDDYEPSDRDEPIPTNLPRLGSPPTRLHSSDNINENSAQNIDREFT